jgi:hypothetical protein
MQPGAPSPRLAQWFAGAILDLAGLMVRLPLPPCSSWLLLWLLLTGFTVAVRFAKRCAAQPPEQTRKALTREAIYGAGVAGV